MFLLKKHYAIGKPGTILKYLYFDSHEQQYFGPERRSLKSNLETKVSSMFT